MTTIILSCSIYHEHQTKHFSKGEARLVQYKKGLQEFFHHMKDIVHNFNVVLCDNSCTVFPIKVPSYVNVICYREEATQNIGQGVINQWKVVLKSINRSDYIIHFEPRQILKNVTFFTDFLTRQRNMFQIKNKTQIWTGLFAIEQKTLERYIENIKLSNNVSLEDDMFVKIQPCYNYGHLHLTWHDAFNNMYIDV